MKELFLFDADLETPISDNPVTSVRVTEIKFDVETTQDRKVTIKGERLRAGAYDSNLSFEIELTGDDFNTFCNTFKSDFATRLNQTLRVYDILGPNDSIVWN